MNHAEGNRHSKNRRIRHGELTSWRKFFFVIEQGSSWLLEAGDRLEFEIYLPDRQYLK